MQRKKRALTVLRDAKRLAEWGSFRWHTRGDNLSIPPSPAFTPLDAQWFCEKIKEARFYLEFGSGASTLLAAQAGCMTVAIESDRRFADAVVQALPASHNVSVHHADIGLVGAWGYPVFQQQTPARVSRWRVYTNLARREIDRGGSFPDFFLIDGRFRVACALSVAAWAAAAKANTTLMFDDYRERHHYHVVEDYLGRPALMPDRAAIFTIRDGILAKPVEASDIDRAYLDVR